MNYMIVLLGIYTVMFMISFLNKCNASPPLGAASAARVYRVLAAVVSSLRERTRQFPFFNFFMRADNVFLLSTHPYRLASRLIHSVVIP